MNIGEIAQLISALTAAAGLGVSLLNRGNIKRVKQQTDGMHKEVVEEVRKAADILTTSAMKTSDKRAGDAHAEGLAEGRAER